MNIAPVGAPCFDKNQLRQPNALVLIDQEHGENVYGAAEITRSMNDLVQIPIPRHTRDSIRHADSELAEAEVIFSGWGMEQCDTNFLSKAPKLKAIFYAAGTVRGFVTDALWDRGIRVSSANLALAACVAEFTLGQILLSLKGVWQQNIQVRLSRSYVRSSFPGIHGSTVGLISVGAIARHLISLLKPFHLNIIAYDPLLSDQQAHSLGIKLCSLEEVLSRGDVVSVHTPWLPETERLIRGRHLELMRPGTTFINTSRGAVVDQTELIDVFSHRSDLFALLDVTYPEPPPASSPIYDLPNVLITPHIAGALGAECGRLGIMAIDEFRRYLQGEPLQGEVTRDMMGRIA